MNPAFSEDYYKFMSVLKLVCFKYERPSGVVTFFKVNNIFWSGRNPASFSITSLYFVTTLATLSYLRLWSERNDKMGVHPKAQQELPDTDIGCLLHTKCQPCTFCIYQVLPFYPWVMGTTVTIGGVVFIYLFILVDALKMSKFPLWFWGFPVV